MQTVFCLISVFQCQSAEQNLPIIHINPNFSELQLPKIIYFDGHFLSVFGILYLKHKRGFAPTTTKMMPLVDLVCYLNI